TRRMSMKINLLGASLIVLGALALSGPAMAQMADFQPVTDDDILNPAPEDWIHWRNTLDGWGYSQLDQITAENVGNLDYAWGWAMEPGSQETTPIVHDGIMYLASPGAIVQALDATSGQMLWEYRREMPEGARPGGLNRGLAIYGDKIYVPTPDAALVALNAET